jgi:hypothetical protein
MRHTAALLQVSLPLHTLPSLHELPLGRFWWVTPVTGLQPSVVQGLLSLITGAGTTVVHCPAPLQAC